jgi:P pilus assembly chaperone PapD
MIFIQSNRGSRERLQLLIDQGINEDLSESVRSKLINAFKPVAIYGAQLRLHFIEAYKNKEDFLINPPVFCMHTVSKDDVKFFAVQQKSFR